MAHPASRAVPRWVIRAYGLKLMKKAMSIAGIATAALYWLAGPPISPQMNLTAPDQPLIGV